MVYTEQCSLCSGKQYILTFYTKCVTSVELGACCFTEVIENGARELFIQWQSLSRESVACHANTPHRKKVMQKAACRLFLEISEVHHCSHSSVLLSANEVRPFKNLCSQKNYSLSRLLSALAWPINWELPQNPNKCYGTPSCHFAAFLWGEFQFFVYLWVTAFITKPWCCRVHITESTLQCGFNLLTLGIKVGET